MRVIPRAALRRGCNSFSSFVPKKKPLRASNDWPICPKHLQKVERAGRYDIPPMMRDVCHFCCPVMTIHPAGRRKILRRGPFRTLLVFNPEKCGFNTDITGACSVYAPRIPKEPNPRPFCFQPPKNTALKPPAVAPESHLVNAALRAALQSRPAAGFDVH